ncbi:MAG: tyrosine-type recombinase/integrase [bacterium]|nr:tyrosine-type recombinase/integrase [bacterium]
MENRDNQLPDIFIDSARQSNLEQQVNDSVIETIANFKYADRTIDNYRASLINFENYCLVNGYDCQLPIAPEVVANYLEDIAHTYKMSVVEQRLYAIRVLHSFSHKDLDPTRHVLISLLMDSLRRKYKEQKLKKARALMLDDLIRSINSLDPENPMHIRDKAILLLGWYGALRASELLNVKFEHLELVPGKGYLLIVPFSKTDQTGDGLYKAIPYKEGKSYCPVTAIDNYRSLIENEDGHLFRTFKKGGIITDRNLDIRNLNRMIKRVCSDPHNSEIEYSSHSLRAGFVTTCQDKDITDYAIMNQTGHKDIRTLAHYNRPLDIWRNNAVTTL